ncbi:unnamed protein product [Mytilus coruscus]|uniref:Uncharacterized protein n=1 Tax=Mytilus coruscus TaxID=42192 RepID=A0A6J8EL58_MYTCO|nr:unnamed protein product [Mytilus coruscus]
MMFGCSINLPIDLTIGHPDSNFIKPEYSTEYVYELSTKLEKNHEFARKHIAAGSNNMKRLYDRSTNVHEYKAGDAVWLYNPVRSKGLNPKLQRPWQGPFSVLERINAITLYRCGLCSNHDFDRPFKVERHMDEQHSNFGYMCPDCKRIFLRRDSKHKNCKKGETGGKDLKYDSREYFLFGEAEQQKLKKFKRESRQMIIEIHPSQNENKENNVKVNVQKSPSGEQKSVENNKHDKSIHEKKIINKDQQRKEKPKEKCENVAPIENKND